MDMIVVIKDKLPCNMEVKADVVEQTEGSSPGCIKQAEKPKRSEYSGHHRGLRPKHAFMGETWELERGNCLLVQ